MRVFFFAWLITCASIAASQQVVDVDKTDGLPLNAFYTISGSPVVSYRFVRLVEGTPYFSDNWMKCLAVSDDDKRFKGSQVKLELVYQDLYYRNEKGEEFICTSPLREMTLTDTVTNTSYYFVNSSFVPALSHLKKRWYQQLVNGKVALFKATVKTINESKPYNSAVAEQRINTTEEYYLIYNGTVLRAKKPKEVPALLADGKSELEIFLTSEELKRLTTAEQMTALVKHYNSLQ